MNLFDELRSLSLPLGQYVVASSAAMMAHGIREAKDIDLVVTPMLYELLELRGWEVVDIRPDFRVLRRGLAEAAPHMVTCPGYQPNIIDLIANADIVGGFPFMRLSEIVKFKRAMGRPKDLKDIELIIAYLNNQ